MSPDLTYHPGLTNEAYHALQAVSPSQIKVLNRSPFHYYDQFLADDREKREPTPQMIKGTALHTAVLEPELWDSNVVVKPPDSPSRPTEKQLIKPTRTGTRAHDAWLEACDRRDWWIEFDRTSTGKLLLSPDDADQVRRMADAVRKHPAARFLLDMPGRREASYTWTDPQTGLECKTRPDWHSEDRRIVVDVKTTRDASRAEFAKTISNLDYHVQAAWNQTALGAEQFITIAVENVRPFAVAVYPASGGMIAAGQRRIDAAMALLAPCWASGVWPGYGDLVQDPIELPGWCRD
jgi:exodeoxyribonuclease VIII